MGTCVRINALRECRTRTMTRYHSLGAGGEWAITRQCSGRGRDEPSAVQPWKDRARICRMLNVRDALPRAQCPPRCFARLEADVSESGVAPRFVDPVGGIEGVSVHDRNDLPEDSVKFTVVFMRPFWVCQCDSEAERDADGPVRW